MRIYLLVPEGSGLRSWLTVNLGLEGLDGLAIFLVAGLVQEIEQGFARTDKVCAVFFNGVFASDGSVLGDDAVVPLRNEVVDGLVTIGFIYIQERAKL